MSSPPTAVAILLNNEELHPTRRGSKRVAAKRIEQQVRGLAVVLVPEDMSRTCVVAEFGHVWRANSTEGPLGRRPPQRVGSWTCGPNRPQHAPIWGNFGAAPPHAVQIRALRVRCRHRIRAPTPPPYFGPIFSDPPPRIDPRERPQSWPPTVPDVTLSRRVDRPARGDAESPRVVVSHARPRSDPTQIRGDTGWSAPGPGFAKHIHTHTFPGANWAKMSRIRKLRQHLLRARLLLPKRKARTMSPAECAVAEHQERQTHNTSSSQRGEDKTI